MYILFVHFVCCMVFNLYANRLARVSIRISLNSNVHLTCDKTSESMCRGLASYVYDRNTCVPKSRKHLEIHSVYLGILVLCLNWLELSRICQREKDFVVFGQNQTHTHTSIYIIGRFLRT